MSYIAERALKIGNHFNPDGFLIFFGGAVPHFFNNDVVPGM